MMVVNWGKKSNRQYFDALWVNLFLIIRGNSPLLGSSRYHYRPVTSAEPQTPALACPVEAILDAVGGSGVRRRGHACVALWARWERGGGLGFRPAAVCCVDGDGDDFAGAARQSVAAGDHCGAFAGNHAGLGDPGVPAASGPRGGDGSVRRWRRYPPGCSCAAARRSYGTAAAKRAGDWPAGSCFETDESW